MGKPIAILDSEIYRDYYLLSVRFESGDVEHFEMFEGKPFPAAAVREVLRKHLLVSFNGANYDLPLLSLALAGKDCATIKAGSDAIILTNVKGWQVANQHGVRQPKVDHIDLFELAPGQSSLKIYGGRLHTRSLQDLPYDPAASIGAEERAVLRDYCANDLQNTFDLYNALKPQIELRERMSEQYGQDLRSRGDAQIAEHVIVAEVDKLNPYPARKPENVDGVTFHYVPPTFIGFETVELQGLLEDACAAEFTVVNGKIKMPEALNNRAVRIGAGEYRLGIGGLHSSEQSVTRYAGKGNLVDCDVTAYYPSIILNLGLYPKHLGPAFLEVYRGIVERRVAAKHSGDKVTDASLKIVINASFGKFGNKWSALYSPDLFIQVTLTGQLALLMLIEHLEQHGIRVVSANTDGIVMSFDSHHLRLVDGLVGGWEMVTGFETETVRYSALHSRDVNNYIAIREDGRVKCKGVFASAGLAKNPTSEIVTEAVVAYLTDGTPLEETIGACKDIRKFLSLRKVQGGALDQMGCEIGKTVRWYYSTVVDGPLTYKVNGYTVPRTDGARALQVLPAEFPADVDLERYVAEAVSVLEDLGVNRRQGELFNAA